MSFKREISGFDRLINLLTFKKHQPVSQTGLKLNTKNHLSIKDHIIVDITSWIINTDIFQLCQSVFIIYRRVDEYIMPIHRGLMRLYLFQGIDNKEREMLKNEIISMLTRINSYHLDSPYFNRSYKKLTASEYYEMLYWDTFQEVEDQKSEFDHLKQYVVNRFSGNYIYDIEYNKKECSDLFEHFFVQISNILNSNTFNIEYILELLNMFDIKKIDGENL